MKSESGFRLAMASQPFQNFFSKSQKVIDCKKKLRQRNQKLVEAGALFSFELSTFSFKVSKPATYQIDILKLN